MAVVCLDHCCYAHPPVYDAGDLFHFHYRHRHAVPPQPSPCPSRAATQENVQHSGPNQTLHGFDSSIEGAACLHHLWDNKSVWTVTRHSHAAGTALDIPAF